LAGNYFLACGSWTFDHADRIFVPGLRRNESVPADQSPRIHRNDADYPAAYGSTYCAAYHGWAYRAAYHGTHRTAYHSAYGSPHHCTYLTACFE